jgi:preprotein translocase subunit YajC
VRNNLKKGDIVNATVTVTAIITNINEDNKLSPIKVKLIVADDQEIYLSKDEVNKVENENEQ